MRSCALLPLIWWAGAAIAAPPTDAGTAAPSLAQLVSTYLTPAGDIDYARWAANRADVARLDALLTQLRGCAPPTCASLKTEGERLAYWVNLYNALVISRVLEHWPLSSVQQVAGFFDRQTVEVGGRKLSLDQIEQEIVHGQAKDPRAHFVLNCGSRGCPPVRPYQGEGLKQQLDAATRRYVNDPRNVEVRHADKTVLLSKVFEWYAADLASVASDGTVLGLIADYASPELRASIDRARRGKYRLEYRDYDWLVNAAGAGSDGAPVGKVAPDSAWPLWQAERPWSPKASRGRVLVIDFWASWCQACREEMPALSALWRKQHPRGLDVVGVSADESLEAAARAAHGFGAEFPVALDASGSAVSTWGVGALPTTVLIDRRGVVRFRHEGYESGTAARLEAEVEQLLAEP